MTTTPSWRVSTVQDDLDVDVVSEDPPRVEAAIEIDDERLTATIESDLSVGDVERTAP